MTNMVILGKYRNRSLTLSIKPGCITLSLGGASDSSVYSFDYTGRLWTAMLAGKSYRRGLDGKVVAKWEVQNRERQRRWLSPTEAAALEETSRQAAAEVLAGVDNGAVRLDQPLPELGRHGLRQAAAFDSSAYRQDVASYHQVYKPVGILPPDQYMAVVLQATEGCSFNTCTFCDFYRGRPFRIKKPEDFRRHAETVKDYLGEGLNLRRTLFFGDANALVTPMPRLLPLFDIANEVYDVERLGGIYAFLDGFSGERKTSQDYTELAKRGLKRVYIGMESGSEALLQFLKKPGKPSDVAHAVEAMKAGGVAVGVIVLLGAGGHAYAKEHVRETIAALNNMPLDLDDIIYFSELIENEDLPYVQDAYQAGLKPLTAEERIAQANAIERSAGLLRSWRHPAHQPLRHSRVCVLERTEMSDRSSKSAFTTPVTHLCSLFL